MSLEANKLRTELTEICWYMRGSVSWDQAYQLSIKDRKNIVKQINDNQERTKKSGLALL